MSLQKILSALSCIGPVKEEKPIKKNINKEILGAIENRMFVGRIDVGFISQI